MRIYRVIRERGGLQNRVTNNEVFINTIKLVTGIKRDLFSTTRNAPADAPSEETRTKMDHQNDLFIYLEIRRKILKIFVYRLYN